MARPTPGTKKNGTSVPSKRPPAAQVEPFTRGGKVRVAAPRVGKGRKSLRS